MRKLLDRNDPIFHHNPWLRWVTTGLPLAWGCVEFLWIGDPFWGVLFIAAGAYAAYELFFRTSD
ncbi:hypothetical protein [Fuscibacter oryzae]|uniref:DUF3329 domain-containing protein n=1 Tax=Fuscibacter oryzae TaxID=2803939 RepID=A0A8J7SSM6_9RHOB|nr:hypothetical protein [Fuscibacter oryzae]MBL4928491.1 hypothetical protein [Fuscibacter oryzae]